MLLFVVCAIIIGVGCGSEPETGSPSEKLVGYCPVVESSPKCYDIEMVDHVEEAFLPLQEAPTTIISCANNNLNPETAMSCDYDLVNQIKTNQSDRSDFQRIAFEDLGRAEDLLIGLCGPDHQIGMYRNLVASELGFFCEDCGLVVSVRRRYLTSQQESRLLSLEGHQDMVFSIKQLIEEDSRSDKERLIRQIQCLPDNYDTTDILSYLVDRHLEG